LSAESAALPVASVIGNFEHHFNSPQQIPNDVEPYLRNLATKSASLPLGSPIGQARGFVPSAVESYI